VVVAAQRGDREAQRALYERYRDRVYSLVVHMVADDDAAEDVLQAVFLRVFRSLAGFRGDASLATWIYRIALNESRRHRSGRRAASVPIEELFGSGEELDPAPHPDAAYSSDQRREIVSRAVQELTPRLREVVVLRYVEELSYEQIATILGCAEGTVASRLHRALAELESRLRVVRRFL
jgi:RNA polymerase sigma-70 factor (ECF subfamily)